MQVVPRGVVRADAFGVSPAHPDYKPPAMPENVHPLIPWKEAG